MKNDFLRKLFKQVEKDFKQQCLDDIVEELRADFNSSKAKESATLINELYKKYDVKDDNDVLIQVSDPSTIANHIEIIDDNIKISLSEDQRQFLMSDMIYGLRAINLKYINPSPTCGRRWSKTG